MGIVHIPCYIMFVHCILSDMMNIVEEVFVGAYPNCEPCPECYQTWRRTLLDLDDSFKAQELNIMSKCWLINCCYMVGNNWERVPCVPPAHMFARNILLLYFGLFS